MSPNTALFAIHPSMQVLPTPSSSKGGSKGSRLNDACSCSTSCKSQADASSISSPLLAECEALKQKIQLEHPEKTTRFSLSHMRRVAIPPVEIPPTFTYARTVVAGKRVPFTRSSWMRCKHEQRLLRRIRENDELRL